LDIDDLQTDSDIARLYRADRAPSLVIAGQEGSHVSAYGIRLVGIPSGHGFSSLVRTILLVSSHASGLSSVTREILNSLSKPVKLQVFSLQLDPGARKPWWSHQGRCWRIPLCKLKWLEPPNSLIWSNDSVPQTTINDGATHVVGAVEEDRVAAIKNFLQ
jgi:hypothetical protein